MNISLYLWRFPFVYLFLLVQNNPILHQCLLQECLEDKNLNLQTSNLKTKTQLGNKTSSETLKEKQSHPKLNLLMQLFSNHMRFFYFPFSTHQRTISKKDSLNIVFIDIDKSLKTNPKEQKKKRCKSDVVAQKLPKLYYQNNFLFCFPKPLSLLYICNLFYNSIDHLKKQKLEYYTKKYLKKNSFRLTKEKYLLIVLTLEHKIDNKHNVHIYVFFFLNIISFIFQLIKYKSLLKKLWVSLTLKNDYGFFPVFDTPVGDTHQFSYNANDSFKNNNKPLRYGVSADVHVDRQNLLVLGGNTLKKSFHKLIFYRLNFLKYMPISILKQQEKWARNILNRRKALENTSYNVRVQYHSGWLPLICTTRATALVTCFYNTNLSIGKLISARNPMIPNIRNILEATPTYKRKQSATSPVVPVKSIFSMVVFFPPYFLTPPRGAFENRYSLKVELNNSQKSIAGNLLVFPSYLAHLPFLTAPHETEQDPFLQVHIPITFPKQPKNGQMTNHIGFLSCSFYLHKYMHMLYIKLILCNNIIKESEIFITLWGAISLILSKALFIDIFYGIALLPVIYFLIDRKYPQSFTTLPSSFVPLSHPRRSMSCGGTTIVYLYIDLPLYSRALCFWIIIKKCMQKVVYNCGATKFICSYSITVLAVCMKEVDIKEMINARKARGMTLLESGFEPHEINKSTWISTKSNR